MTINDLYLWCVATITTLVGLNTIWRLWSERDRLAREDLNDIDRAFAWRIVIFLIFPLINLLDLRSTDSACQLAGGYLSSWNYGLLWYHAVPAGLSSPEMIIPVLFAGSAVTTLFALCLVPALFFRPHPFLATVIGYTVTFTLGLNLIADPLLSAAGLGSMRWQIALTTGAPDQRLPLLAVHLLLASLYLCLVRNTYVRLWFSSLTRPIATEQLRQALTELQAAPQSPAISCLVGILYDQAGLRYRAKAQLKRMKAQFALSPYTHFLDALVAYSKRDYKVAKKAFVYTCDFPGVDGELKASLLAAAACATFADNDITGALNLCERALEFDDACLVARMVKVDVFMHQGKKDQAGDEILYAMHLGLSMELEGKIPLDIHRAYDQLAAMAERQPARHLARTR